MPAEPGYSRHGIPLETLWALFGQSYVILAREGFTPASPGDCGFIFGRAAASSANYS